MARFRLNPITVDAYQWFKNGDHPEDGKETVKDADGFLRLKEGAIVRYFRHPDIHGNVICACNEPYRDHGFIDDEEGQVACPGDWIITEDEGYTVMHEDTFKVKYAPRNEETPPHSGPPE